MSDFSNLVKFKNDLSDRVNELSLTTDIDQRVSILTSIANMNPDIPIAGVFDQYIQEYRELDNRNQMIISSLNSEIAALTQRIDLLAKDLFNNTAYHELFKEINVYQQLILNDSLIELIRTRIGSYSSWMYPGLILYPREKKWTIRSLVANEPLYIIHDSNTDMSDLLSVFTDEYKARLRLYTDIALLPKNQFGFILCWDWLNYLSFDRFDWYLRQIYSLLRPGGSCMFSYNNCDLEGPARCAETNHASYANFRLVRHLIEKIGFDLIESNNLITEDAINTHISWVEIRKPGRLATIKAHPALAEIKRK